MQRLASQRLEQITTLVSPRMELGQKAAPCVGCCSFSCYFGVHLPSSSRRCQRPRGQHGSVSDGRRVSPSTSASCPRRSSKVDPADHPERTMHGGPRPHGGEHELHLIAAVFDAATGYVPPGADRYTIHLEIQRGGSGPPVGIELFSFRTPPVGILVTQVLPASSSSRSPRTLRKVSCCPAKLASGRSSAVALLRTATEIARRRCGATAPQASRIAAAIGEGVPRGTGGGSLLRSSAERLCRSLERRGGCGCNCNRSGSAPPRHVQATFGSSRVVCCNTLDHPVQGAFMALGVAGRLTAWL